jgi:hypothetical protein
MFCRPLGQLVEAQGNCGVQRRLVRALTSGQPAQRLGPRSDGHPSFKSLLPGAGADEAPGKQALEDDP